VIAKHFDYHAPESIDDVVGLLDTGGDARILAGGTWLVPDMTRGDQTQKSVVDIRRAGLDRIRAEGDGVAIGAAMTYTQLLASDVVRERAPLLRSLASTVTGGPQIRNQGTIGGSACYAFPSSDVPACLVALDARLRLVGPAATREVDAKSFFLGAFTTAARADELLAEIVIPAQTNVTGFGYYKLKHCQSSWPIATGACVIRPNGAGAGASATLALGGVSATPVVVPIEEALIATTIGPAELAEVEQLAVRAVDSPWSDVLADGEYRRLVAGVVAKRALRQAVQPEPVVG
jgi:carbon-monoxide dehydrogenase medium subunit